tara:strand:- start:39 stop:287 length:249 start_codon:yes stop_codon:yes gene_type:complete
VDNNNGASALLENSMNNYELSKNLKKSLGSLLDVRYNMNVENENFYTKAISVENSIKSVQTAIDNIPWTEYEINAQEARYDI